MIKKIVSVFCLIFTDAATIFLSYILAYIIRCHILPTIIPKYAQVPLNPLSFYLKHGYLIIIWLAIFAYEKLYVKRYALWEEVKFLFKGTTLSSLVIVIIIFFTRSGLLYSRTMVIIAWLLSLILLPAARISLKHLLIKLDIWQKKLLIVGIHQTSLSVVDSIKLNKSMGYEIIGFIEDDPQKIGKTIRGIPIYGPMKDIEKITISSQSKDIMIVTPHLPRNKLRLLLDTCERISDSMWLIPRAGDFITEGVEIEVLGDILTLYIKRNLAKPWNTALKTFVEWIITVVLLLLASPFFLLLALAIKLDSKGPIFYSQKRAGKNKEPFYIYKFRSMYVNNEAILDTYLKSNEGARKELSQYKKLKKFDPRITRVGKLMRKFSLDELPQLINVLQGNMSLVGPRPYLEDELEDKERFKDLISKVKPGLTGLWQVSGRSELPFQQRINLDEFYIRNWSLWLDFVILAKTFREFISSKGAY